MSRILSRRSLLKGIGRAVGASILAPQTSFGVPPNSQNDLLRGREVGELGRMVAEFKRQFNVPALSVAITRHGQFVYDRAFGIADRKDSIEATTESSFRIASVTKPITSVAIFTLIEKGKFHLDDKVFGSSGILGNKYGKGTQKQYVTDVTVDHLLTHSSGGWPADASDPMFQHDGWDHTELISWTLDHLPLTYPPGQHWAYSNFGYCLLGRVIEQVSGRPYADYVQTSVLTPCGIQGMQIAQNSERKRAPNEVDRKSVV